MVVRKKLSPSERAKEKKDIKKNYNPNAADSFRTIQRETRGSQTDFSSLSPEASSKFRAQLDAAAPENRQAVLNQFKAASQVRNKDVRAGLVGTQLSPTGATLFNRDLQSLPNAQDLKDNARVGLRTDPVTGQLIQPGTLNTIASQSDLAADPNILNTFFGGTPSELIGQGAGGIGGAAIATASLIAASPFSVGKNLLGIGSSGYRGDLKQTQEVFGAAQTNANDILNNLNSGVYSPQQAIGLWNRGVLWNMNLAEYNYKVLTQDAVHKALSGGGDEYTAFKEYKDGQYVGDTQAFQMALARYGFTYTPQGI